jgi:hypothetical protein
MEFLKLHFLVSNFDISVIHCEKKGHLNVTLGQTQNSALTVLIDPTVREDWDGNLWTRIRTAAMSVSH